MKEFVDRFESDLEATAKLFPQLRSSAAIDQERPGVRARFNAMDAQFDTGEVLGLLEAARRLRLVP